MVWRQEKVLRTNLQPNPSFRATSGYITVRTNLCTNPSFPGNDLTGWANWPGAGSPSSSMTQNTGTGADGKSGFLRQTWTTPPTTGGGMYWPTGGMACAPNTTYTVSAYVRCTKSVIVYINAQFYGDGINNPTKGYGSEQITIPANTWVRINGTFTSGTEDTLAQFRFYMAAGPVVAASDTFDVDCVLVEQTTVLGSYFDGSTVNGSFDSNLESAWAGTANASPSVARGQAPADWTTLTLQGWRSWIAEDGKSVYLRYNGATVAGAGTGAMYTGAAQTVPVKSTVSASLKVRGTNPLYMSIQGYGGAGEGSGYGPQVSGGSVTSQTHTYVNPDVNSVRLIVRVPVTAPGTTYQITQALLEVSPTVGTYFDGSYPSATAGASYRWNGAAERSTSDMYIPALASPPAGLWDSSTSGYAESWYVDGVDVQSMAFGIETVDSQPPTLKGDHLALSGANGVIPQFNRAYEPGSVALKMWVLGCEVDGTVPGLRSGRRQLFERNLRMLLRLFGYQGNVVTLKKTIYGDSLDSAPITVTARAIVSEVANIDTQMARQRATVSVALTLVDSFWSDATVTTDTTGASATVPKTLNLTDVGTAPVDDAVIKITGPITSPRVTCPASGSWIQYNGTVPAGQTLTIDSKVGTAVLGTNSVLSNVTHGGTAKFMVIPPRNQGTVTDTGFQTALTLSGSSAGTTTSMSVSYYRKHWVIV